MKWKIRQDILTKFVGAVISALSDKDFVLLDITSDGNNHYSIWLENLETKHKIKIWHTDKKQK
jgi:hypothetical protein